MNLSKTQIKKICENKIIFIGFSGGPDSRVVLDIFEKIFGAKNIILLHFNHKYRKESDEEQKKIKKEFSRFKIYFGSYVGKQNENSWRRARYEFFLSIMKKHQNPILVLGHNLDDRIETSFLNMLNGSGIIGFLNMKKISQHFLLENIEVYRPLIEISKKEILEYLKKNNLDFFVDHTNFDENVSLRNYIRKNIILEAQKQKQNFLSSWQENYKLLEKIKLPKIEKKQLKLPKIFETKNIKIYKLNFPKTIFETYVLMKNLGFGNSININSVNNLFGIILKRKGLFEVKNNFIYVNILGVYFGNNNIKDILKIEPEKLESSKFAKYKNVDNIIRYTQPGDKYKSKPINKRAINKKIPIFLRKFVVVEEKDGKIIYCDMPYEY